MDTLNFIWKNIVIKILDKLSLLTTLILIILKLTNVLEIAWIWILSPIWGYVLITSPIWITLIIYNYRKRNRK